VITIVENISKELSEIVNDTSIRFKKIPPEEWEQRYAPGKWSRKQVLGHLIDSASNNHQRFVRALLDDNLMITYTQENWVTVQDYNDAAGDNLINLWINYNKHLAYVISKIPKEKYGTYCNIGKEQPVTLEWLVKDYIRHLKHHLNQILGEI
jgi:hypothetical protein